MRVVTMDRGDASNLFSPTKAQIGRRGMPARKKRTTPGLPFQWVTKSVEGFLHTAPDDISSAPPLLTKSLNYTKPELRDRLKRQIMAGERGGRSGQWSARKAQLLAQEYRKRGGGYKGGLRKTQRSLRRWTREKWTTSDGKPANRDGGMRRYLPARAWSRLSPAERAATNRKKITGDRQGNQFVANTEKARTVGRNIRRS